MSGLCLAILNVWAVNMSGYVIFVHIGMANPALKWPREYPPQLGQENVTRPNERNVEQK